MLYGNNEVNRRRIFYRPLTGKIRIPFIFAFLVAVLFVWDIREAAASTGGFVRIEYVPWKTPIGYRLKMEENGKTDYIAYDCAKEIVSEVRRGFIPPAEVKTLFGLLDEYGFFQMKESYIGEPPGTYEGDQMNVEVKLGDRYGKVSAVSSLAPTGLLEIIKVYHQTLVPRLQPAKVGFYVRAEMVGSKRRASIENESGFSFIPFGMEEFRNMPGLEMAILDASAFIEISPEEVMEIKKYIIAPYGYFFISSSNVSYQITIIGGG